MSISGQILLNFIYWWQRLRGMQLEGLSSGFCKQFSLSKLEKIALHLQARGLI